MYNLSYSSLLGVILNERTNIVRHELRVGRKILNVQLQYNTCNFLEFL